MDGAANHSAARHTCRVCVDAGQAWQRPADLASCFRVKPYSFVDSSEYVRARRLVAMFYPQDVTCRGSSQEPIARD